MLKVATYNIHKGFSPLNRRVVLHELRGRLHELNADIVFLQEVQGEHAHHAQQHADYPDMPQHEFLADPFWLHHAYGMNSVYETGHHGNAILSRFPIVLTHNRDVSAHRFEQRGLLHCEIDIEGRRVHCLCTHFGLFARGRRAQLQALIAYAQAEIPATSPLLIAGDFNDWRGQLSAGLTAALGVEDVFCLQHGKPARSFPAAMPLLKLDRIYMRGFDLVQCQVRGGRNMSDHAALTAQLKKR